MIRISDDQPNLHVRRWDDRAEMVAELSKCAGWWKLLAESAEYEADLWSAIMLNADDLPRWGIGIVHEGAGVDPELRFVADDRRVWVGCNHEYTLLDCETGTILHQGEMQGCFHEFLAIPDTDDVIVVGDLTVLRATPEGRIAWQYDTSEMLTGIFLEDNHISVQTYDGTMVAVGLDNGEVMPE